MITSKYNVNQIELSLKEIHDFLTLSEIKKIEFVSSQIKAYNDTLRIITESNYDEIKHSLPLIQFIDHTFELLQDLPDPRLEI